jgi:hypothetical protein
MTAAIEEVSTTRPTAAAGRAQRPQRAVDRRAHHLVLVPGSESGKGEAVWTSASTPSAAARPAVIGGEVELDEVQRRVQRLGRDMRGKRRAHLGAPIAAAHRGAHAPARVEQPLGHMLGDETRCAGEQDKSGHVDLPSFDGR